MKRTILPPSTFIFMALMALMLTALPRQLCAFTPPEQLPERFEYILKWGLVVAGQSSMELSHGEEGLVITSTATSADWVTSFYPVKDIVTSRIENTTTFFPLHYRINTLEGTHRKDKEVLFARLEGAALYRDNLKEEEQEYEIPEIIFDPLSIFYRVRQLDLVVGKSIFVPLFDSKKIWNVEVQVIKKETIKVPAGTFDTILIKPKLESEGIFYRKGEIFIWLTDDERRIPVKLKTKVSFGSIIASMTGGQY